MSPSRSACGTGDRAVAPQNPGHVVGFLGALQAGRIAVPLPVPRRRAHDERTISVLSERFARCHSTSGPLTMSEE